MTQIAPRSYKWLFWCLALLGFALDVGSKYAVFGWLYRDYPANLRNEHVFEVFPGVFNFSAGYTSIADPGDDWRSPLRTLSSPLLPKVNHGALWGIGGRGHEHDSDFNDLFALVSVTAAAAIIIWICFSSAAHDRWLCVALGLILAGTLGNLYDRIVFDGVRDFLAWIYLYHWPVFNIADSCLVCGAGLLLVQAFFAQPARKEVEHLHAPASTRVPCPAPQPQTVEAK